MKKSFSKKFEEDMILKDYSDATRTTYTYAVKQFFKTSGSKVSANDVTEEDLRDYLFYLKSERNYQTSALKIAVSGLRFFLRPL